MKRTSRVLALILAAILVWGLWAPALAATVMDTAPVAETPATEVVSVTRPRGKTVRDEQAALAANDEVLDKVAMTLNGPAVGKTLAQVYGNIATNNLDITKPYAYWYDGETGDYLGDQTSTREVEADKSYTLKISLSAKNCTIDPATTKVTLNGMPMTKEGNLWVVTLPSVNIEAPTTVELQLSNGTKLTIQGNRTTDWENPTYHFNWRVSSKVLELLDGFTGQSISATGPLTIRLKGACTLASSPSYSDSSSALHASGDLNILADNASDSLTITQHGGYGGAINVNSEKINLYGGTLNINMTADGSPYSYTYPGIGSTSAILRTYGNAALNMAVDTADTRDNYTLVALSTLETHGSGPIHVQASRAGGGEVRAVSNLDAYGASPVRVEASRSAGGGDVVAVYNLYGKDYPGERTITLSAQGSSNTVSGNVAVKNVINLGAATTLRAEKGILSLWGSSTWDARCPDISHYKVTFAGSHPEYRVEWKGNKFWAFFEYGGSGVEYITDGITMTPYSETEYGFSKMELDGYADGRYNNPTTKATLTFDRPVAGLTAEDFTVTGAAVDRLEAGAEENQYLLYLKDFTAEHREDLTVTPDKEGYTFYPASRSAPVNIGASMPIVWDYFPNMNFRSYLLDKTNGIDADGNGCLSAAERASVVSLTVPNNCDDLRGIEYFPNLTTLVWKDNPDLTSLTLDEGLPITALEVSGCSALTQLDVSKLTALETLNCSNNALTALDVSQNTALTTLNCANNALTGLDVSHNTALEVLSCQNNALVSLDLSQNTALTTLNCSNNKLLFLDLTKTAIAGASGLNSAMNYGELTIGADGTCDLSALAGLGFDYSKMTVTAGGSRSGSILTVTGSSGTVSYTYNAGKSLTLGFTAHVTPRAATPTGITFSFDGDNARKLMNTTAAMAYSLDGGETWLSCGEGSTQLSSTQANAITAEDDILVKVVADGTHAESLHHVIDITVHETPSPTFTATGTDSGVLTGTTKGMVYITSVDHAWYSCAEGTTTFSSHLAKGTVIQVKTSRSDTRLESESWSVTLDQADTPEPTFTATDKDAGTLSAVSAGMAYKVGEGEWTAITGETAAVTGLAKGTVLQVCVPGGVNTLASEPWSHTMGKAGIPGGVYTQRATTQGGADGQIAGVDSTMEWQAQGESSWTKITSGTAVTGLTGGEYKVRVAAKEDVLASEAVTVTVADGGAEEYLLWVGGERVTTEKLDDYSWAFDPATSTLTVKNGMGIFGKSNVAGPENAGIYSLLPTLTIKGPDNVDAQKVHAGTSLSGANSYGIYAAGDLIITDGANLAPLSKSIGDADCGSYRIYTGGKLTLDGISLYTEISSDTSSSVYYQFSSGQAYGIYCDSLDIKNGTNITGWTSCRLNNTSKFASAIHIVGEKSDDGFTITNSTLAIDGAYWYNAYGISFADGAQGEINIGAGADVLIQSDKAVLTKAPVLADGVTITASTSQTGTPQVEYSAAGLAGFRYLKMSCSYGVTVAGVSVTPANKGAVTGSGITGTVTYDPLTHTLTLANATITASDKSICGIYADIPQLNIAFTGNNTIETVTGGTSYDKQGAICNTGSLVLEGPGDLAVINRGAYDPSGIVSTDGGISITGGKVDVTVGYAGKICSGLLARNDLLVKNATLNVTIPESRTAYGLSGNWVGASNQGTTLDHATVKVSIQATFQSRAVGGVNITITESALTVAASDLSASVGLAGSAVSKFKFNSGEVLIQAGKAAEAAITGIDAESYDALASENYDGSGAAAYDSANMSYKYIHIAPKAPKETYTITYNANGGGGTMSPATATEEVDFTLPACGFTPPTAGKCFKGWAIGSAAGEVKAAGETHIFTADTDLYAIWGDLVKETTPAAALTLTGESTGTLGGVTATMKYQIGSGAWLDGTGANIPVTDLSVDTVIRVVKKGNGSTTVDSEPQIITLERQAKPVGVAATPCTTEENDDGTLTGITANMEWRKAGTSAWTAGTGSDITGQSAGDYEVRTKCSDTKLASMPITVTVAGYTPPDLTITLQPGSVSGDHITLSSSYGNFDMVVDAILALYDGGEMKEVCMGQLNKTTGVLTAAGKDLETGDWRVFLLGGAYAPVCEKLELSED